MQLVRFKTLDGEEFILNMNRLYLAQPHMHDEKQLTKLTFEYVDRGAAIINYKQVPVAMEWMFFRKYVAGEGDLSWAPK